jgi:hypothetical protein
MSEASPAEPTVTPTGTQAVTPAAKPTVTPTGEPISPKSRAVAAILAWTLGIFGVHRFYVGKTGTGILMIVTLGGLVVWTLIDFVIILVGNFRDKENRVLLNW